MTSTSSIKWPEIFSLAGLNAAVVISWIAYHEYQPVLLEKFQFNDLASFIVIAQAIILILIPPLAGLLADKLIQKYGKFFTIFTVGIGATAMIFMIVASIIGAGPLTAARPFLPIMIIFWLVSMNLFISPANSMIEAFAPAKDLPLVMGVLVLVTELLYSLEPIVVEIVHFFGDTLTFIVGGLLIGGTGYLFHRVSSNEVIDRKKDIMHDKQTRTHFSALLSIVVIGLGLGLAKALITEYLPYFLSLRFPDFSSVAKIASFSLLGFSAILAFVLSRLSQNVELNKLLTYGMVLILLGFGILFLAPNFWFSILGGTVVASAFGILNISGLPYAIQNLSVRHITYGVGMFIGASEVFSGLFNYYF